MRIYILDPNMLMTQSLLSCLNSVLLLTCMFYQKAYGCFWTPYRVYQKKETSIGINYYCNLNAWSWDSGRRTWLIIYSLFQHVQKIVSFLSHYFSLCYRAFSSDVKAAMLVYQDKSFLSMLLNGIYTSMPVDSFVVLISRDWVKTRYLKEQKSCAIEKVFKL